MNLDEFLDELCDGGVLAVIGEIFGHNWLRS